MSGCDCGCVDLRNSQFAVRSPKECQLYHSDDRKLCIPFYTSLLVRINSIKIPERLSLQNETTIGIV